MKQSPSRIHCPLSFLLLAGYSTASNISYVSESMISELLETDLARCESYTRPFDPFMHKSKYRVGVHAIRGLESAYEEYEKLFADYLTRTAGQKFDPPIEFEMAPYLFEGIFQAIEDEELDFVFANPGIYSCIGVEVGAAPLATIISRLEVRGQTFDLDVYGGVIATRSDNKEINTILDLKDKVIGAGAIVVLMGGQSEIYEMEKAGLSHVNDPKQMVFTHNQEDVVHGILNGDFDAGFVRTDQIERTVDENGEPIDSDKLKVIEPKIYVMDDGSLFPFLHSTPIYPEWPVASMPHVPRDVALEVQEALLHFEEYVIVGKNLEECYRVNSTASCDSMDFPYDFNPQATCDMTKEIAELCWEESKLGKFAGFRPARSYFDLRTMHEAAGFLLKDEETGDWHCTRSSNLYEGIYCPEGYYKRSVEEFENGCKVAGLECKEGYDCFCRPCVKAYEVDVYEHLEDEIDYHLIEHYGDSLKGCDKMSICATIQQGESVTLRAHDNALRDNADVRVLMHGGASEEELEVTNLPGTHAYEFTITETKVQVQIIEIYVNGEQIPESPIRVMVEPYDCSQDYGLNSNREPDGEGNCICQNNTYEILGDCIKSPFFFLIIFGSVFVFIFAIVFIYLGYKKNQNDSVWVINVDELHFNEPPEVIGQGGFGVVILGQYRGTKVAVKRVIPPSRRARASMRSSLRSLENSKTNSASDHSQKDKSSNSKEVKFGENTDGKDVEAQSGSTSVSKTSKEWADFMNPQKADSVFKVIESATLSSHGSQSLVYSSRSSSRFLDRWLPDWLDFGEQTKLKNEFISEMRLLSRLRHPCITTVMGAVIAPKVDPMLVMEYMEYGSLYDLLQNETMSAGGEVILQIIRDIVQGVQFLHASKPPILHGDLKAKNILVDNRFRAKVADFGFSHFKAQKVDILHGTPFFMAPEYLRRRTEYTTACDIYSFSMILYEIYARADPFEGQDPKKVLPKICHPRLNKRPEIPEACPPKVVEIMKKCWSANPFFRPSAKDLDYLLVEMSSKDTEPLIKADNVFKENMTRKPTSLYDVFPKHIADALNAGQTVEAESHEIVTVVFSDIVGFTSISQSFTPLKVSNMLDRLYQAFDELSRKHHVFKVETIGDAYMGVTNLDGSQFDTHVKHAAEFAMDMVKAASQILIDEEAPDKGYVQIRVGFHSGAVVSNVIGSLNPRYGLFGDTVNTASRMETNSAAGRVLCSYTSAKLLQTQAPEISATLRGKIKVKGKGSMMTYWIGDGMASLERMPSFSESPSVGDQLCQDAETPIVVSSNDTLENRYSIHSADKDNDDCSQQTKDTEWSSFADSTHSNLDPRKLAIHNQRVINSITDMLLELLKGLVATRATDAARTPEEDEAIKELERNAGMGMIALEEAVEFVPPPQGGQQLSGRDPDSITLSRVVEQQLHQYVGVIANMYNDNPFHSFDHASHVTKSSKALFARIKAPESTVPLVQDPTFGLGSDKMAQFAVVFSSLIHDVDHRGIPNFCLAKEDEELKEKYKGKALAEQNSIDLGWEVLMYPEFEQLRACIYTTTDEFIRFRKWMINIVVASEIFDQDLNNRRKDRWRRAFQEKARKLTVEDVSRKATAVVEFLMQASDVAHTMQNWQTYVAWNQRLFEELYVAYENGRFPKDPSGNWYQGEIGFFDNYVIPLATRLKECGVFGETSNECLDHAVRNRREWVIHGESIVANAIQKMKSKGTLK